MNKVGTQKITKKVQNGPEHLQAFKIGIKYNKKL